MFSQKSDTGYQTPLDKIRRKTLVSGEKTLMSEFLLEKGAQIPRHKHPHEQTGYLISGHILLRYGDQQHEVHPGDSWCIAGEIEHQVDVLEDSVVLEVFAPVREDYLP